jgi:predicted ester cyclase
MAVTASANTPFLAVESPRELLHQSFVSSARNRVSADFQSHILAIDSSVFGPRACRHPRATSALAARRDAACQENRTTKAIVARWFTEFWGQSWNPRVVDELCAPDVLLQYLLQTPHCGRADVKTFMTTFRQAFPDLRVAPVADFVTEGDYVVGRWVGTGTHTGPAYCDFLVGCLPAASGQQMRFMGTTVLRIENGKIAEQIGLDDEVTASLQLGLTGAAW